MSTKMFPFFVNISSTKKQNNFAVISVTPFHTITD